MQAEERLPADIFEEMAGVRDITPIPSPDAEANVNTEVIKTEPDEGRLLQVGYIIVESIPEFGDYIQKLAKKLLSFQKKPAPAPKKRPKIAAVTIHIFELVRDTAAKSFIKLWSVIKWILKIAFKVFKLLLKILMKLAKWAFKLMWKVAKFLIKVFWKVLKLALKVLTKVLKVFVKVMWKLMKAVFRALVKLGKAFWNLMIKLFNKIKKKKKKKKEEDFYWTKEPKMMNPKVASPKMPKGPAIATEMQPKMGSKSVEIFFKKAKAMKVQKIKISPVPKIPGIKKKRESMLWRVLKKILNPFFKMLGKLIKKVFMKIIKKLIGTVVKLIVRFIINMALALIPFGGPLLMMMANAISTLLLITEAVEFIRDLNGAINSAGEGNMDDDNDSEEEEERELDDSDLPKAQRPLNAHELRLKLEQARDEGRENAAENLQYKREYMTHMLQQAQAENNAEEVKKWKEIMGIPEDSDSTTATISDEELLKLDFETVQKELANNYEKQYYDRKEINKHRVIGPAELEEVLVSADGETDWMTVWRQMIIYIRDKVIYRTKMNPYRWYAWNAMRGQSFKIVWTVKYPNVWWPQRKANRINNFVRDSLETYILLDKIKRTTAAIARSMLRWAMFGPWYLFSVGAYYLTKKVIGAVDKELLIRKHKSDLWRETADIREEESRRNRYQRKKLSRWIDVLEVLSDKLERA